MFILKKGHQRGVYVPLRALFLVLLILMKLVPTSMGFTALSYEAYLSLGLRSPLTNQDHIFPHFCRVLTIC